MSSSSTRRTRSSTFLRRVPQPRIQVTPVRSIESTALSAGRKKGQGLVALATFYALYRMATSHACEARLCPAERLAKSRDPCPPWCGAVRVEAEVCVVRLRNPLPRVSREGRMSSSDGVPDYERVSKPDHFAELGGLH